MTNRQQLEQAIAVQESLRGQIDDAIVDATIAALRVQLAALEPPAHESRRALATILFVDLAGHTDLIQGRDPEEIMEIIDRALERLAEPIVAHGGRIVRYQGDGYKAVFGLPVARENDPDNAVRAGLGILATAADLAAELEAERNMPGFQVRVGIATGLVLTGGGVEGEDTVTGLPVNLAARLESLAVPGTVLIAHDTYRHIRGVFDFLPLEPVTARGFPEPVPVYRVLRQKPHSFRTRRRGVEGIETRMIGRDAELAALQELFAQAVQRRERSVIVVVGEAGLGKSRLLYEFENWVDLQAANVQHYRGRGRLETQHLSYGLLRDVFVSRCGIFDDDTAKVAREKFVGSFLTVMGEDDAVEMKAHLVGHLLGYDFSHSPHVRPLLDNPRQLRDQAFMSLKAYFRAAAGRGPLLILLEDLHWVDDGSLDAITALAAALDGHPVVLLGVARPTLYERHPDWLADQPTYLRLRLKLLDETASGQLVTEILQKMEDIPGPLCDLIVATAEGNPFYAEELIKMFIDEGIIVKGDDIWEAEMGRLAAIRVPPTLTGVLQARLEALPPSEQLALQRASVVGRLFWDTAVDYLGDASGMAESAWPALRRREIIFLHEETAFEGTRQYTFSHALVRDVAYEGVLRRLRRVYHRRAAEWLIRAGGDRVDEYAHLIAAHFAQAGDDAGEAEWQGRAGKQAAARYAMSEAVRALSRALELLPTAEAGRRFDLLLHREKLYNIQAARDPRAADLDELERLADDLGDAANRAEVALRRASHFLGMGDFQAAIASATRAAELAADAGDVTRQARAAVYHGNSLRYLGDFVGTRAMLNEALALARAASAKSVEMDALRSLGIAAQEQGDLAEQHLYFDGALRLARETGDLWGERRALNSLGIVEQNKGAYGTSQEYYEQSLAIARNIGDRMGENTVLGNLGVQAYGLGQYPEARAYLEEALQIARDTDDVVGVNTWLLNLAYIVAVLGDIDRALAYYDETRVNVEEAGDRPLLGYVENGTGRVLLEGGRPSEAIPPLRQALALREEMEQLHLAAESRLMLAEALAATGSVDEALATLEEALIFLQTDSLETTEDTTRGLLAAYRVLSAAGDDRAGVVLERAYNELQAAAALFDDASRRAYLTNVPCHREIVALRGAMARG